MWILRIEKGEEESYEWLVPSSWGEGKNIKEKWTGGDFWMWRKINTNI